MNKHGYYTVTGLAKFINVKNVGKTKLLLYLKYAGILHQDNTPNNEYGLYIRTIAMYAAPPKIILSEDGVKWFKATHIDKLEKWLIDFNRKSV